MEFVLQMDPGLIPGAAGSLVFVCNEGRQKVCRTKTAGGLATSVILPREARILEEGAVAHA